MSRRARGTCDGAFQAVADAFDANFDDPGEIGAAVALSVQGRLVVDLWAGDRIRGVAPWESDTLVDVFSVGKGMVATAMAVLVDQHLIDLDAPVSTYWPEFGVQGKHAVTVAQLMSHQAGVPGVKHELPNDAIYNWDFMTETLAQEIPWWEPGTRHGYHVNTLGFLAGEVIQRVSGRDFGEFFRHEVAERLGADFLFGVPAPDDGRVAEFYFPDVAGLASTDDLFNRVYRNPLNASGFGVVNSPQWRRAVHPSTNGHATASGIATIYGALATIPTTPLAAFVSPATLGLMTMQRASGDDEILRRASRFGCGYQLTQPERPLGPNAHSFGHFGAGGSLGFADPDAGLGFGYCMNRFGHRWQDPRNQSLIAAAYASL